MDLLPPFCTTQRFTTFDVFQAKKRSYCHRHSIDQFLPLAIEVFGCLHKLVDVCANVIWSFILFLFWLFFHHKHVAKDASILYLKSCDCDKLNYFPTSTLSRHTPHHHNQPITSGRLLKWKDFDI